MGAPIDFAIVTALVVEREAVLRRLNAYTVVQDETDPLTYYRGHVAVSASGESYQVVVIMLLGMGNNEAAVATTRLVERWHPAAVMMVGIGAGVPGEVSLGDVVVADYSYYYEPAKLGVQGRQQRGQQFHCDRLLFDRARAYRSDEWCRDIGLARPDGQPLDAAPPKVRYGPIACGEKVVADETTLANLRIECPKLMALAMEGAGVARAAAQAYDRPRFLEVRGVSDYASPEKNDAWHGFAAHAAAAFAIGLLRARPVRPAEREEGEPLEPAAAPPSPVRHNLPSQLSRFVGREREIGEVKRLLDTARLVTLSGSGGVGKTRLALQVATELVDRCADGAWLVELAALSDPQLVPQAVASALGVREEPGRPLAETLGDYLRGKELLLVLDNCEHLVLACARLAETLLRQCPKLTILASSREALRITGEVAFRVPSLATPDPAQAGRMPAAQLTQFESVRLFIDRAVAVMPRFAATDAEARDVARICHQLDGIPLAIELAAARVRVMPVDKIAARLDNRLRLLTGGSRTALPRQQTLRAMIDWSYDLLDEPERGLLRRLSVFAGGCTLDAAEAVCAFEPIESYEVFDLLTNLVDKSLVVLEERAASTRYRLLETIRQYAGEKLHEADQEAQAQDLHFGFFLQLSESAELELLGAGQMEWLDRLEAEHDNLRAALERALQSDKTGALRLAGAMGRFWDVRSHFAEGRHALRQALERVGEAPREWLAKALLWAGLLAMRQGYFDQAEPSLAESLSLYRALGDATGCAASLNHLGNGAYSRGNYEQAERYLREGLELSRALGDPASTAYALIVLGNVAWTRGDEVAARRCYEDSLAIRRKLGDKVGICKLLNNLGGVAQSQGDHAAAQRYLEDGLAMARELGDQKMTAYALVGLGEVSSAQRDHAAARDYYGEALNIARELGDKIGAAYALEGVGNLSLAQRDFSAARRSLEESLLIRIEIGDKERVVSCLEGFAKLACGLGQADRALRLFAAVATLRQHIGALLMAGEQSHFDSAVAEARKGLADQASDEAWSAGAKMGLDDAVADAMGMTHR